MHNAHIGKVDPFELMTGESTKHKSNVWIYVNLTYDYYPIQIH